MSKHNFRDGTIDQWLYAENLAVHCPISSMPNCDTPQMNQTSIQEISNQNTMQIQYENREIGKYNNCFPSGNPFYNPQTGMPSTSNFYVADNVQSSYQKHIDKQNVYFDRLIQERSKPQESQHYLPSCSGSYPHYAADSAVATQGQFQEVNIVDTNPNSRVARNVAEKQRRDKLNKIITELSRTVPLIAKSKRKFDKISVLRLTAHYLRAYQHVFSNACPGGDELINAKTVLPILQALDGFLITCTYKGVIVVASDNIHQYLGYTEIDLLGHNIYDIVHVDDRQTMKSALSLSRDLFGPRGEVLVPGDAHGRESLAHRLAKHRINFIVRLRKNDDDAESPTYSKCHISGLFRLADRAGNPSSRQPVIRRARRRAETYKSSGNDLVFIGMVHVTCDSFMSDRQLEAFRPEYQTRHSVDGQIIECDQRISLVAGYMTDEINGSNAMNFMHRDEVRWVALALRQMFLKHQPIGESCYRLIARNGSFIYLLTRGCLEIEKTTNTVKSFLCTHFVVDEKEGRQLIDDMKKKYSILVDTTTKDALEIKNTETESAGVEDPSLVEKVIMFLVSGLPDSSSNLSNSEHNESGYSSLPIIPPDVSNIKCAIAKSSTILSNMKVIGYDKPQVKDKTLASLTNSEDGAKIPGQIIATKKDEACSEESPPNEPKKAPSTFEEKYMKHLTDYPPDEPTNTDVYTAEIRIIDPTLMRYWSDNGGSECPLERNDEVKDMSLNINTNKKRPSTVDSDERRPRKKNFNVNENVLKDSELIDLTKSEGQNNISSPQSKLYPPLNIDIDIEHLLKQAFNTNTEVNAYSEFLGQDTIFNQSEGQAYLLNNFDFEPGFIEKLFGGKSSPMQLLELQEQDLTFENKLLEK